MFFFVSSESINSDGSVVGFEGFIRTFNGFTISSTTIRVSANITGGETFGVNLDFQFRTPSFQGLDVEIVDGAIRGANSATGIRFIPRGSTNEFQLSDSSFIIEKEVEITSGANLYGFRLSDSYTNSLQFNNMEIDVDGQMTVVDTSYYGYGIYFDTLTKASIQDSKITMKGLIISLNSATCINFEDWNEVELVDSIVEVDNKGGVQLERSKGDGVGIIFFGVHGCNDQECYDSVL